MAIKQDDDFRVLVTECPEYDQAKIKSIISQGMATLGYKPHGNVVIKPNVVCAFPSVMWEKTAVTDFNMIASAVRVLADVPEVKRIDINETPAVGNPSRLAFKYSGYREGTDKLKSELSKPVELKGMDEEHRVSRFIGGAVHDRVRLSRTFASADTKVYMPKLKCHCVSHMTGTMKLNVGIVNFDDRSIRHDFMLNEKIADLAAVGWPDFAIMDAIIVGVGNEALPIPRKLGLILMGKNGLAVDLVGARLLGIRGEKDVPYLAAIIKRGYKPAATEQVQIIGDAKSLADIDRLAERIKPYNEEFYRWQDVNTEFKRMNSPLHLYFGPYSDSSDATCDTGCIMGIKMYLAFLEKYVGAEGFAKARPTIFVIGKIKEPIDAKGAPVFVFGSCSEAEIKNAKFVSRINKCFVTASDMFLIVGNRTGMKSPFFDPSFLSKYVAMLLASMAVKTFNGRYLQDFGYYLDQHFFRKI